VYYAILLATFSWLILNTGILLSTLFSNTLSLCSLYNVSNHVSHLIQNHMEIYRFDHSSRQKMEGKRLELNSKKHSLNMIYPNFNCAWIFFLFVIKEYLNCQTPATVSKMYYLPLQHDIALHSGKEIWTNTYSSLHFFTA
jgi:hypothetical protein